MNGFTSRSTCTVARKEADDQLGLAASHTKKTHQFRNTISAEARSLLSKTQWSTVYMTHLHHKAQDPKDKAGRLHMQGSSPSLADDGHRQQAYFGARKRVHLHTMEAYTPTDTTFGVAV